MLDSIWNSTLTIIKFVFGTGGLFVFASKNVALAGAALFWHHDSLSEAASAIAPFVLMLLGDGAWCVGLILLRKHPSFVETCVVSTWLRLNGAVCFPRQIRGCQHDKRDYQNSGAMHSFRVATTGNA